MFTITVTERQRELLITAVEHLQFGLRKLDDLRLMPVGRITQELHVLHNVLIKAKEDE